MVPGAVWELREHKAGVLRLLWRSPHRRAAERAGGARERHWGRGGESHNLCFERFICPRGEAVQVWEVSVYFEDRSRAYAQT